MQNSFIWKNLKEIACLKDVEIDGSVLRVRRTARYVRWVIVFITPYVHSMNFEPSWYFLVTRVRTHVRFDRLLFLRPSLFCSPTSLTSTYSIYQARTSLVKEEIHLVHCEISQFLYLFRKRRDVWIVSCFFGLSVYLAECLYHKDQSKECSTQIFM